MATVEPACMTHLGTATVELARVIHLGTATVKLAPVFIWCEDSSTLVGNNTIPIK